MAQIFLCYAREDEARVRELYARLKGLGFDLWMDKVNLVVGQRWGQEIPKALRLSSLVLVCLSKNSVGKIGYVQREFKLALDTLQEMPEDMIHTLPVRLDECEVPAQFSELHWCNLFEENGFEQLVAGIRYGLEQRGEPAPASLEILPLTSASTIALPSSFTNSIGMEFVLIPAGTFTMGSADSDELAPDGEKPAHQVTISQPFYMGKYEVTQAQWKAVMADNPSRFKGDDRPVENVSWDDVQQFIEKLNEREKQASGILCRLPTEAEWEYAARAGTTTRYSFGDDASQLGDYAWYDDNSGRETHPVGEKQPNAWGLYDMHGNVWEWVQDRYAEDYYRNSPDVDPQGPDAGADRVIRGGGWGSIAEDARSAHRIGPDPGYHNGHLGFRCSSSGVSP